MVDLCLVCQTVWYSNGGLKAGLKSLFMVQNVKYSNGRLSHLIRPMFQFQLFVFQMVTEIE